MKVLKKEKGAYLYIKYKRIVESIKTFFMFGCCIGIYFLGLYVLKTNKSIWTIIAVLGVLPSAKSAVNMIMFFRYNSLKDDEYTKIKESVKNIPTLYEMVFTTSEKSYYMNALSCSNSTIIAYSNENEKKRKELSEHILTCINREELKGYTLKIYGDIDSYLARVKEMNDKLSIEDDNSYERLFALLEAVSL